MTLNLNSDFDITQGVGYVPNKWVVSAQALKSSDFTNASGDYTDYTIDLSTIIPDDNCQYEVIVSIEGDGNCLIRAGNVSWGGVLSNSRSQVTVILEPDNRNLVVRVYTTVTSGFLGLKAYRKIG